MPETIACPQCAQELTLPDNMIGKRVRCPACKDIFTAQVGRPAAPPPEPETEDVSYGLAPPPRGRDEGRRRYDEDEDRPPRRRSRRDDDDDDDDYAVRRPRRRKARSRGDAHRGGLILTLGIVGLCVSCCPLAGWAIGGAAMSMGNNDIALMDNGAIDRSGRGMTTMGKSLGTIAVALATFFFIAGIVLRVANFTNTIK